MTAPGKFHLPTQSLQVFPANLEAGLGRGSLPATAATTTVMDGIVCTEACTGSVVSGGRGKCEGKGAPRKEVLGVGVRYLLLCGP